MKRATVSLPFTWELDGKRYEFGDTVNGQDDAIISLRAHGYVVNVEDEAPKRQRKATK